MIKDVFLPYFEYWYFFCHILIIGTFSAIFRIIHDYLALSGVGKGSNRQKLPPNPKSLATISYAPAGIQTKAAMRDSDDALGEAASSQ